MFRLVSCFAVAFSAIAYPWGGTGHEVVGRTAAKLVSFHGKVASRLARKDTATIAFVEFFHRASRELGLLAVVPDSAWRSASSGLSERQLGDPTHYFHFDSAVTSVPAAGPFPDDGWKALSRKEKPDEAEIFGSLPWRVEQFSALLRDSFGSAPDRCEPAVSGAKDRSSRTVLYAGILAHFIGDATQPFHAVKDYDGIEANHGGIHRFFEVDVVDSLRGPLNERVEARAAELLKRMPSSILELPLRARMMRLLAEGMPLTREINAVDTRAPGKAGTESQPKADVVALAPIAVERLAIAAAHLALAWADAWLESGSPPLSLERSVVVDAPFIAPNDARCHGYKP